MSGDRVSGDEVMAIARGLASALRSSPTARAEANPGGRRWVRLLACEQFDVWLIHWPAGGAIHPHDHGRSMGAVAVVDGALVEFRYESAVPERTLLGAGDVSVVEPGVIHDLTNTGPCLATSVHVYSPALSQMGFYHPATLEPTGVDGVDPEPTAWAISDLLSPSHA